MKIGTFAKDDRVQVVKGSFKNLTGVVSLVYEGGEQVQLDLGLQSKPVLIDYPASYIKKIDKGK